MARNNNLVSVDRRHGRIEVSLSGGVIHFIDLGSSNGTEIDGIQIAAHGKIRLRSGSQVRIGDSYYVCVMKSAAPTTNPKATRGKDLPTTATQSATSKVPPSGATRFTNELKKTEQSGNEDLSELEAFVRNLMAQGQSNYQSVRKGVGNRWGLSFFKKHRDFIRKILNNSMQIGKDESESQLPKSPAQDAVGALLTDLGVEEVRL